MFLKAGKLAGRRRGVVAVLSCVCFIGILFLTALAIDAGDQMAARRHAQNCVDAAAMAGCLQLASTQASGGTASLTAITGAANLSATHNNFTNGTNCTVAVNWPPASGSFMDSNSVEVLVTFTHNNMVVRGSNSMTVRSVATCGTGSAPAVPMLVTDPTNSRSFWVNSGNLTMSAAPVQVNSDSATAAVVDGSSQSAANAAVKAVGGTAGAFTPSAKSGGSPMQNPLALVPVPSTSGLTTYNQSTWNPNGSGNVTLNPGYYPNGLYVTNGGNVTMNPGLYYIANGNFWINTTGTVTGNGVTIYHNGANSTAQMNQSYGLDAGIVLCPTDNNYTFTAPTTGAYAGISFFQGPNCVSTAWYDFWGSGQINTGMQYFANSTVRAWSVSNGVINCNELVTKDFKLSGPHEIYGTSQNGGFSKVTWNASRAANRPKTNVYLVE